MSINDSFKMKVSEEEWKLLIKFILSALDLEVLRQRSCSEKIDTPILPHSTFSLFFPGKVTPDRYSSCSLQFSPFFMNFLPHYFGQMEDEPELTSSPSDPELTLHEIQVMEEALQNPLIVVKIMENNLNLAQLQTCRLISQLFYTMATKLILKLDLSIVTIQFDPKFHLFYRHSKRKKRRSLTKIKKWQKLCVLNQILENSVTFPCSNFVFIGGGNLGDSDVATFFKIQGPQIKSLSLVEERNEETKTGKLEFSNILCHYAPNIIDLSIRGFEYDWSDGIKLNSLENLQIFSWRGSPSTALEILKNAPNLKSTIDFDLKVDLDVLIQSQKCPTVTTLHCDSNVEPDKLLKFLQVQTCPVLQHLTIFLDKSIQKKPVDLQLKLCDSLLKLLEFNKNSLRSLVLTNWDVELKFPIFGNLKSLKIGRTSNLRIFPAKTNLTETFPFVKILDCTNLLCDSDRNWRKHFPPKDSFTGKFEKVDLLILSARCTEKWMRGLEGLCPNFTQLILHSRDSLDEILPLVFKLWTHIQAIELKIEEYEEEFFHLDSILTGIEEENCEFLKGQGSHERFEDFERLRVGPSLCDLKEIKRLKIQFDSYSHFKLAKRTKNYLPLSFISGLYCFKLLPQLKVTIEFDQSCHWFEEIQSKFDSIKPYVNFSHSHHDFDGP